MSMFLEIKVRHDGKERWVDASDFLRYMLKEHLVEESSKGGVLPYPDEENKEEIFNLWWNLYNKKRSKKKTMNYWFKTIKSNTISDIISVSMLLHQYLNVFFLLLFLSYKFHQMSNTSCLFSSSG